MADPEYLGELPYIQLLNPQFKIGPFQPHAAPQTTTNKWYLVSRGTAVGIFNNW